MSLGGGANGVQDLLTLAVHTLDQANMISVVAAGNSGRGSFTVSSPGSAARALTASASSVATRSPTRSRRARPLPRASSGLRDPGRVSVGGTLRVLAGDGASGPSLACDPLAAAASASIALYERGGSGPSFATNYKFK